VRATRLLTSHFFDRFLYSDLLAPNGDSQANLALVLAGLAVPGLWLSLGLVFSYSSPFIAPSERLLMALAHKYQFIAVSMIVMALVATLQWDALGLDARDLANLGPLPVAPADLLRAKALALLMLLAAFAVALNAIPSLAFPAAYLSLVPIGLARAAWLSVVHALVTLAAAAFGFGVVVGLRSALMALAGPRLFRRLSTVVQFVAVLALVTLFFLIPAGASRAVSSIEQPSLAAQASPPLWFVGAYERLTAPGLLGDPRLLAHTRWNLWMKTRRRLSPDSPVLDKILFRPEDEARARYQRLLPALGRFAWRAVAGLALVWGLAAPLFLVSHRRHASRLREAMTVNVGRGAGARRLFSGAAMALVVRDPAGQAGFFFTLHALTRSGKHRLHVAGYLALGIALASVTAAGELASGTPAPNLASSLLAVQMTLAFCAVAGLRAAIAVPADLRSNWVFKACWTGGLGNYLAGVRRAAVAMVVVPVLVALLPLHASWWGSALALRHLAVGLLASLVLVEAAFLGCRKLPFTCSYVAKGTLKFLWPAYLAAFLASTYFLAWLERPALQDDQALLRLVIGLVVLVAVLRFYSLWRLRKKPAVVFEEEVDPAAVALGL
jgi:hypothetical protein